MVNAWCSRHVSEIHSRHIPVVVIKHNNKSHLEDKGVYFSSLLQVHHHDSKAATQNSIVGPTHSGLGHINHQLRKCSMSLPTASSYGGIFSFEAPSLMTVVCVRLTQNESAQ